MKLAILGFVVLLVSCAIQDRHVEYDIPYSADHPRIVAAWVTENIEYRSEEDDDWSDPGATWSRGYGDCEDMAILTLYLAQRDAGVTGDLVIGVDHGRWHAWTRFYLDGVQYDCDPTYYGVSPLAWYTPVFWLSYDEAIVRTRRLA